VLLTRLPLRIATAFDLHVLSLPPAFVLSQDQTLKLNENLSPAGHFFRRLSTSPKHTFAVNESFTASMNLSYVTARVSHSRPHCRDSNVSGPQGLRRPRFSSFRFNCQTAKTIQAKQSKQRVSGRPPVYPILFAQTSENPKGNKTTPPAIQGSVAVGAQLIGRARSHCQPPFANNPGIRSPSPAQATFPFIPRYLTVFADRPAASKQADPLKAKKYNRSPPKDKGREKCPARKPHQIHDLSMAKNLLRLTDLRKAARLPLHPSCARSKAPRSMPPPTRIARLPE
jgi:hypothetical protein